MIVTYSWHCSPYTLQVHFLSVKYPKLLMQTHFFCTWPWIVIFSFCCFMILGVFVCFLITCNGPLPYITLQSSGRDTWWLKLMCYLKHVMWLSNDRIISWINAVLGHGPALQGYTEPRTTWANEMNLLWIMSWVPDQSLNLLTCRPASYHCATAAPTW